MSDLYLEELIKRKRTTKDNALRMLMIGGTVVLLILSFLTFSMLFILPGIVICIADIFVMPRFNVEWEYQYVNGEIDIDRILNKARRKRIDSFDISNAEILAPAASHRLDYYNSNSKIKVKDYSSCDPQRVKLVYAMIMPQEGEMLKILFEPSERMLRDLRMKAPRKVFLD